MNKSIFLLPTLLLVACSPTSSSSSSSSSIETSVLNVLISEEEFAVIDNVVKRYNRDSNHLIDINVIIDNSITLDDILENNVDLVYSSDSHMKQLIYNGLVSETVNFDVNEIYSSIISSLKVDDVLYSYPAHMINSSLGWYDSNYFSTFDNLTLEHILLTAKNNNKKVLMPMNNEMYLPMFFSSINGGGINNMSYYYDNNGEIKYETNWDNDENIQILRYISSLLSSYYEQGVIINSSGGGAIEGGLGNDCIALIGGGLYLYDSIMNNSKHSDHIVANKLPSFTMNNKIYQMGGLTNSYSYYVLNNSNEQHLAHQIAKLLVSEEAQLDRYQTNGKLPTIKTLISDIKKDFNTSQLAHFEMLPYLSNASTSLEINYYQTFDNFSKYIYDPALLEGMTLEEYFIILVFV